MGLKSLEEQTRKLYLKILFQHAENKAAKHIHTKYLLPSDHVFKKQANLVLK